MNVNDVITESHQACPHCGGPVVEYSGLMEKKDACYYKVKASAKVWPSAYASGRLVQCRKKGAANYGNKSEGVAEGSLAEDDDAVAAFMARGGEIQRLKPAKPRKGERWQGSAHIGAAGGRGTKGRVSGLGANTGKSGKPVVTAEQGVAEGWGGTGMVIGGIAGIVTALGAGEAGMMSSGAATAYMLLTSALGAWVGSHIKDANDQAVDSQIQYNAKPRFLVFVNGKQISTSKVDYEAAAQQIVNMAEKEHDPNTFYTIYDTSADKIV